MIEFQSQYYIKGEWDFATKIKYAAADTETHQYYNGIQLTEEAAEKLMAENGQTWCKENIEVRAWVYMLSDGINFICFDNIEDFITCCCKNRIELIIWYNAKFDFLFFDDYFIKHEWHHISDIVEEYKEKKHYGKLPAKSYSTLDGSAGQRYQMTIADEYLDNRNRRKVHKFKMIDLCNIVAGGLKKNLEDWDIKDVNGIPIRKLEMDYVNDSISECLPYLLNDTVGLMRLGNTVDATFNELTGYSFWNGDYMTIGGLAKKVLLSHLYNSNDYKSNLKKFHQDFPITPDLDKEFREGHLYKGGMTLVNPYYKGKVVHNIYKFDENSMYPDKMYKMRWTYGQPVIKFEYEDNNNIKIFHITRMVGKIKSNKIGVFYDRKLKDYTELIDEINPFYIFEEELNELQNHYNLNYEYDYIYEYKAFQLKGVQEFVDKYYGIKATKKGLVRNAAKLILNSAYGKLAEKIERASGHYILSDKGYLIYNRDGIKQDSKSILNVVHGAYITTLARVDLMQKMREICNEDIRKNFLYCDTDSINALSNHIQTDPKILGMMKNEGYNEEPYESAIYLAPKTYLMYNSKDPKEPFVLHCKGVSTKEVYKLIKDMNFEQALTVFRPNNPIRCLQGINAQGGKALIYKSKYILRDDKQIGTDLDGRDIFYEL